VVLVRISDDREGEAKGVARQQQDCRRHAHTLSWEIGEIVVENDTSAFKRRKVRLPDGSTGLRVIRPGFRRVLDMLASGEADGLIAYDLDRTCRDPRDLEDLIDVVEARRVPVTSVSGSLRLANDADITMARVMVAVANKSSRDTSRRVARKHEELAESGKPGGGGRRPYGYDQNGMTVREDEAAIVREMLAWALDGWSLRQIIGELNARLDADPDAPGLRPAYSERWSTRSVSAILRGPRIAGLRRFRGEVVGEAAWPAIVDRDDWERVQSGLESRAAGTKNQLARWLTGVLQCGLCGHQMYGWTGHGGPRYWCATPRGGCGKIAVNVGHVEAEIERQVLEYLSKPGVLAGLRGAYSSETVADARAGLAADEQQLKELATMWAQRQISFAEYGEARRIISDRIAASRGLVRSSLPQTVRMLLDGDVRAGWDRLTPAGRRDVVLTIVGGYRVDPAKTGRRVFNPDRLVPLPLQ
jgi:DNA invertase Pin-like site-specific DNA recombinase